MKLISIIVTVIFVTYPCTSYRPKLLLVSFDGFRYDYLDIAKKKGVNISSFVRVWETGFRVNRILNEFTTRTAPSHISIVTGLHEESHGIIDNVFYDPLLNDTFFLHNSTGSKWYDVGGEPIWVTNQRHGYQSAVIIWPSSEAKIKDKLPTYHLPKYDKNMSLRQRMNQMLEWLDISEVTLGLLYYHEPDSQGHSTGPESPELFKVIAKLNDDLDYLLNKIDSTPSLKASLNIILTSDHGMTTVSPKKTIILDNFVGEEMYFSPGSERRINWLIWPKYGYSVLDLYTRLLNKHAKMNVYLRDQMPKYLHYSNNRRISPLILFSDPGWIIVKSQSSLSGFTTKGDHGYDPNWSEMSPFLLAAGPAIKQFKPNEIVESFKSIDIYSLICHVLHLSNPAPNNGSLSNVAYLLRDEDQFWFKYLCERLIEWLTYIFT